jgi:HmuY protein
MLCSDNILTQEMCRITQLCTVNKVKLSAVLIGGGLMFLLGACIKQDKPIPLPPKTGSTITTAAMGVKYDSAVFYNLDLGKVVGSAAQIKWDIAFDCRANGSTMLMNAFKFTRAAGTGSININLCNTIPTVVGEWGYDAPSSLLDSAYLSNWNNLSLDKQKQVHILRQGTSTNKAYYKIQINSITETQISFAYDTLTGTSAKNIVIGKDSSVNFVYFNFKTGKVVPFEPSKRTWDFVFTRYTHPFYEIVPFTPYVVTGVFTNPFNTTSFGDTTEQKTYASIDVTVASQTNLNSKSDNIGYNWKTLPEVTAAYIVHPNRWYLVRTQNNNLHKLHFLDFYKEGLTGFPKLEHDRLQ